MKKSVTVFFNASVIISGLYSTTGGSAKLLNFVKRKKINGIISEIIFNEALKHAEKINFPEKKMQDVINQIFTKIIQAPNKRAVEKYSKITIDPGDAHVLASCQESKANILTSLDKKHILSLKDKIKVFSILSPGELLQILK